ncbi:hypothetical protein ASPACDRAFT_82383 [Aspergillus aculeatus ATCC 16872]|uniref:NmrA-like domain-containing protein n=1 Tax=Aspergillus aculeatus (strain ATCC 16872 / CBS 172.66 / WB 5094) TaxID=690307 RepID=A0A1L9WFL2_ASPA1|nr:uncharacterized protein ASPACDRAFT_82383 [Aspergillus aculeatus ATCC 16872]OJJ94958.1 hypothetical protein ASPACDRAFT_82383 [Aspergillus aculeatus ATCC 16872]
MAATKVALVGASGNLGPAILSELLTAGFDVTVLTRQDSAKEFDSRAHVAKVAYSSLESLQAALAGNEVVVNTLGVGSVPRDVHLRLVDAAVAAGVKRYIPSEFGSHTTHPATARLPVFADKVAVQEHLRQKASHSVDFTYTLLFNGPFLDWGLKVGFLLNLAGPVATLYDNGERKFSTTTTSGVGQAVVGIIKNLPATANKEVFVHQAVVSQRELLALSGKHLETKAVSTSDLEQEASAELAKPSPNFQAAAVGFLRRAIFGEGFGSHFNSGDLNNEALGVQPLSENELRELVAQFAR